MRRPPMQHPASAWLLVGALVLVFLAVGYKRSAPTNSSRPGLDAGAFATLPVLVDGRYKPMDTVARSSLLIIHGKQRLKLADGQRLPAIWWLLEMLYDPLTADSRNTFLIDHAEVLSLIGEHRGERKHFSFEHISPYVDEIERQARLAEPIEPQLRSPFQKQVMKLQRAVSVYTRIQHSLEIPTTDPKGEAWLSQFMDSIEPGMEAAALKEKGEEHDAEVLARMTDGAAGLFELNKRAWFFPIPPLGGEGDWRPVGQAILQGIDDGGLPPAVLSYAQIGDCYRTADGEGFERISSGLAESLGAAHPQIMRKAKLETFFNRTAPFYRAMVIYVAAFLLACLFWLFGRPALCYYGMLTLCYGLALHLFGLGSRMLIEGRPPVTNLYSSAVFVGLGAVVLGAILERLFRNGIGTATASVIGFLTLLIAHHLSLGGDTMEMMRAVLDSNLWLATHVVVITLGYSANFLAGTLGLIYILRKFLFGQLDAPTGKALARMVYGTICFATLFSFIGTILGGIWADQSWGRFWGWDPKENGALLIVIWNAIILHARWGGMVRERGLMVLAVFGNIVTSWSWFGTNMLGVGLHSYGFTDAASLWLTIFVLTQLAVMAAGTWGIEWRPEVDHREEAGAGSTTTAADGS